MRVPLTESPAVDRYDQDKADALQQRRRVGDINALLDGHSQRFDLCDGLMSVLELR